MNARASPDWHRPCIQHWVMSAQGGRATTALIERVCDAHRDRDPQGPLVTAVEGVWAFCAGFGASDHVWRAVEPVTRQRLEADLMTREADALGH